MINLNLPSEVLVSIINCYLRDHYDHLDSLCEDEDIDKEELITKLHESGYCYDEKNNQFKLY